ncbi:MAG: hypothetical protein RMK99_09165 [Anaerolineales bacterium]|nr:hypothetical protein [Anaerolineales bacterium]
MNKKLINALRRREASTSVGPSTVRKMGPKGTVPAAREYLANLNLKHFATKTEQEFQTVLDRATYRFLRFLPEEARHWGVARKLLNIFLRGAVYNRFLCKHYGLHRIEQWLELPLDSHVAKGLRREKGGEKLSKWTKVISLDKDMNRQYQEFAAQVAKRKKTYRVHLDVLYWRADFVMANNGFQVTTHRRRRTRT